MDNLLLSILYPHEYRNVSIGHQGRNRVAWIRASIPINPDLIPNLQSSFKIPEGCLFYLLNPVLEELVQGDHFELIFSDQTLLFLVDLMLWLIVIFVLV